MRSGEQNQKITAGRNLRSSKRKRAVMKMHQSSCANQITNANQESARNWISGAVEPSELIEPIEQETPTSPEKRSLNSGRRQPSSVKAVKAPTDKAILLFVQMSRQWIDKNIKKSVYGPTLSLLIKSSYSRHLFYCPLYHPSLSPKEHASARLSSASEETHRGHKAFHYGEEEVKKFVNKRKKSLIKKHGALASLALEA